MRDSEFDRDVKDRLDQYEKEKSSALALAAKDSDNKIQALKSEKELEIEQLKINIERVKSLIPAYCDRGHKSD